MASFDKWVSDASPDMVVGNVARRALKLRLGNVIHFLPLAAHLADESIEYVHAARVGTRRAHTGLRLFADFVPDKHRKTMSAALRSIRRSMGNARDLDVYIKRFGQASSDAESFLKRLKRKRRRAQMPIIECATPLLSGQRLRQQTAKLLKQVRSHAKKSLREQAFGQWASGKLREEWHSFLEEVPDSNPSAGELHQFRIASKRFRYAIELLSSGLPAPFQEVVYPQAKQLQGQLGEIQDHAVAAEKLNACKKQADGRSERAMLAQFEQDERDQYHGKSEAFAHWWRRDRLNDLRTVVEGSWTTRS